MIVNHLILRTSTPVVLYKSYVKPLYHIVSNMKIILYLNWEFHNIYKVINGRLYINLMAMRNRWRWIHQLFHWPMIGWLRVETGEAQSFLCCACERSAIRYIFICNNSTALTLGEMGKNLEAERSGSAKWPAIVNNGSERRNAKE